MVVGGGILVAGGHLVRSAWIVGTLVPLTIAGTSGRSALRGPGRGLGDDDGAMIAGAMTTLIAVTRMWGVVPPAGTVARVALVSLAAGLAARRGRPRVGGSSQIALLGCAIR